MKFIIKLLFINGLIFAVLTGLITYNYLSIKIRHLAVESETIFQQTKGELLHHIKGSQWQLKNQMLALAQNPGITESADLGDASSLTTSISRFFSDFAVFDFEGDLLTGTGEQNQWHNYKPYVDRGLAGQVGSYIKFTGGVFFIVAYQPLGDYNAPSGVLVVIMPIDTSLLTKELPSLRADVSINVQPQAVPDLAGPVEEYLYQMFFHQSSLDLSRIDPSIKGSIYLSRNVMNPEIFDTIQSDTVSALFPIILLLMVSTFVTYAARSRVLRRTKNALIYLHKKDNKDAPPKTDKLLRESFGRIWDEQTTLRTRIEELSVSQNGLEAQNARILDIVSIDDYSLKLFFDSFNMQVSELEELLADFEHDPSDDMRSHLKNAFSMFCTHLRISSKLFKMDFLFKRVLAFEIKIKDIENEPIEIIRANFETIRQEIESYNSMRRKLMGRPTTQDVLRSISSAQVNWLKSLVGRMFTLIKRPGFKIEDIMRLGAEFEKAMSGVGRIDLKDYIDRYDNILNLIADEYGKKVKPIGFEGDHLFLDQKFMSAFHDIILRLIHNSVQHGIEGIHKRIKLHKPDSGQITIHSEHVDGQILISIMDDGRGFKDLDPQISCSGVPLDQAPRSGSCIEAVRKQLSSWRGSGTITAKKNWGTSINLRIPDPRSRFLGTDSLFDIRGPVSNTHQKLQPLFEARGIALNLSSGPNTGMVLLEERFFREAINKIYGSFLEQEKTVQTVNVHWQDVGDERSIQVIFNYDTEIFDINHSPSFQSALNSVLRTEGHWLELERGKLIYSFRSKMPLRGLSRKTKILTLLEDYDAALALIYEYFHASQIKGQFEIFLKEKIVEFYEASKHQSTVAIIDYRILKSAPEIQEMLFESRELNLVIVSEDINQVDASLFDHLHIDPLLVSSPIDRSAIYQALELAVLIDHEESELDRNELVAA